MIRYNFNNLKFNKVKGITVDFLDIEDIELFNLTVINNSVKYCVRKEYESTYATVTNKDYKSYTR